MILSQEHSLYREQAPGPYAALKRTAVSNLRFFVFQES